MGFSPCWNYDLSKLLTQNHRYCLFLSNVATTADSGSRIAAAKTGRSKPSPISEPVANIQTPGEP